MPVSVARKDQVPDGQREEVDQHPEHIGETVCGDDDEDARETENESQEDQRDGWSCGVHDCCLDRQDTYAKLVY